MKKYIIIILIVIVIIFLLSFMLGVQFIKNFDKSNSDKELAQTQNSIKNETQENNINNEVQEQSTNEGQKIYYLHKSNLENPSKNQCATAKTTFFKNINENERKDIQTEIRIYSQ